MLFTGRDRREDLGGEWIRIVRFIEQRLQGVLGAVRQHLKQLRRAVILLHFLLFEVQAEDISWLEEHLFSLNVHRPPWGGLPTAL